MLNFPLKGIFFVLVLGGAVSASVSALPKLVNRKRVSILVLATSKNGKKLYVKLEDLKQQSNHNLTKLKDCERGQNSYCPYVLTCLQESLEESVCEEELETSTSVNLGLDNKKLFLSSDRRRGLQHSLHSPKKDGKFYLLEEGSKKIFGEKEISDTRDLKQYITDNTDYLTFKGEGGGLKDSQSSLEQISDCAYFKDESFNDSTTIICAPHPISTGGQSLKSQSIIKDFEKEEIVYYWKTN